MGLVIPKHGVDPLDGLMVFYVNVGDRSLGEAENYLFEFKERYWLAICQMVLKNPLWA